MSAQASIPDARHDEYEAVQALLMKYADPSDADASRIAEWIARSSLGDNHLYQDMGFTDRSEVRRLMERHFPAFAAQNTEDMRWKKFIWKRLCGWEGFHT